MADHSDAKRLPTSADETQSNASTKSVVEDATDLNFATADEDATVLAKSPALEAEEFPLGLSPHELSLTLKGQLLDHFQLQEFIGGGGMGAVFKALDTTLDRIVAVKVVASQSVSSEDLQRRFLVEAQSTARLDHPNIARIHYVGRARGLPYIVFEYIEGVNLRDLVVNHGTIPVGDALSFTYQIAHALAHAWQKAVVHRDIKPSNILITREGQAKLVDMGLARLSQVNANENELTSTGMTLGTFDYISPEQARDPREVDTRSDIYSLGCTLFYMLAGRPPFAEGTAVQKLLQHQDQTPPNLSELRPEIPAVVSKLVSRMLAKSAEQRPQTPTELVHDCEAIFQELGLQPPQSLTPLPLVRPVSNDSTWKAHLPWVLPVAALIAVAAVWSGSNRSPTEEVIFPEIRKPTNQLANSLDAAAEEVIPEKENTATSDQAPSDVASAEQSTSKPSGTVNAELDFNILPPLAKQSETTSLLEFPPNDQVPVEPTEDAMSPSIGIEIDEILLPE